MTETALISVDIDLDLINRRLKETGELTAKEAREIERTLKSAYQQSARAAENAARKMAKAQSMAAREAEREAKRAAREIERSFNEQASSVRGLFSAALGGIGGDILDLTDTLGGMSKSLMLVGGALAAVAIAPEVIRGMHEFAAGAKETAEELGRVMTPEELARAEEYERGIAEVSQAMNELKLDTQLLVGDAMLPLVDATRDTLRVLREIVDSDAVRYFSDLKTAIGESKDEFFEMLGPLGSVLERFTRIGFIGSDLANLFADAEADFAPMSAALLTVAEAAKEAEEQVQRSGKVYADLGTSAESAFTTANEKAKNYAQTMEEEAVEAIAEGARQQRELEEAVRNATAAIMAQGEDVDMGLTVAELGRVNEAAAEASRTIQGIGAPANGGPTPMQQFFEDVEKVADALGFLQSSLSPILSDLATLAGIEQRQHEDRVAQLRDQRALSRDVYQSAVADYQASREDMTAAEQAAAEDYLSRLKQSEDAKRAQIREIEREEKKAAREAFKRQKELQIAQATIDAARNAVVLTGSLSFLTFGAPFAAAGIALGQLKTQLAIIEATPPPKFHFGTPGASASGGGIVGIPGAEVPAVLEQGEGVVSRRGMATPGMAELVAAINEGRAPAGRSTVTDTEADMLAQRLNRPYAPAIRGRALAGTNTFYRGR